MLRNTAGHPGRTPTWHRARSLLDFRQHMHLSELKALHVSALIKMGEELEIENVARMRKQELMFAIMKKRAKGGEQVFGDGLLEVLPDGFGFLRSIDTSYMASTDDIYLSPSQIRRFNLHN